jgi:BlaI family transcriptional regulator, penicillinase repressor
MNTVKNTMKELTRAEEQIMQILWKIGKGFVNDILDRFPDPKPAYNTVSTIVRILEKKGFVKYTALGKSHQYYPAISKKDYTRSYMRRFVDNYFGNSYKEMVSFFTQEENLSVEEMDAIRKFMSEQMKRSKQQ